MPRIPDPYPSLALRTPEYRSTDREPTFRGRPELRKQLPPMYGTGPSVGECNGPSRQPPAPYNAGRDRTHRGQRHHTPPFGVYANTGALCEQKARNSAQTSNLDWGSPYRGIKVAPQDGTNRAKYLNEHHHPHHLTILPTPRAGLRK